MNNLLTNFTLTLKVITFNSADRNDDNPPLIKRDIM